MEVMRIITAAPSPLRLPRDKIQNHTGNYRGTRTQKQGCYYHYLLPNWICELLVYTEDIILYFFVPPSEHTLFVLLTTLLAPNNVKCRVEALWRWPVFKNPSPYRRVHLRFPSVNTFEIRSDRHPLPQYVSSRIEIVPLLSSFLHLFSH